MRQLRRMGRRGFVGGTDELVESEKEGPVTLDIFLDLVLLLLLLEGVDLVLAPDAGAASLLDVAMHGIDGICNLLPAKQFVEC